MTFKGFNITYPEYEVITPQTNLSFHLRSLSIGEEETLKGSLITVSKIASHLNKCLYETSVKKPEEIKDYDSFLKSVTIKDRDVLLFGLYHITYEEIRNYGVVCGNCSYQYQVTVKASDTFNYKKYTGADDILTKQYKVNLPVYKGVSVYVRQPTLYDEINAETELASRPGSTDDVLTETLVIGKIVQNVEDSKKQKEWIDRTDIIDAYKTLVPRDKRVIHTEYEKRFGQYGMKMKMKVRCQKCGREEEVDLDITSRFFRTLHES